MRIRMSLLNSSMGIINRCSLLISNFLIRYFFARFLIGELLGYDGLFSNILGLLSVIELGLGTSIAFSLYKPINEGNEVLISAYMSILKKIYLTIGSAIFFFSICLAPFLNRIIKGNEVPIAYIEKAFIIYAASIAITYFFSYNRTIIFARQRNYIILAVDSIRSLLTGAVQIICIILSKNYYLFLVIQLLGNLFGNIIITIICNKRTFYIKDKAAKLTINQKQDILTKAKDITVTSILGKCVLSTDSLLISMLIGAIDLAKNANYSLMITAVQSIVTTIMNGASASIGDLIADGNKEKIRICFYQYSFIYYLFASFSMVSFYYLSQPFICIWVGERFLFGKSTSLILSLNIYLYLIQQPVWTFQNMGGLFSKYKRVTFFQATINLFSSIIFGKALGIIGIFIGTFLCYTYSWVGFVRVLNRNLMEINQKEYWKFQIKNIIQTGAIFGSIYIVSTILQIKGIFLFCILLAFIVSIYVLLWLLVFSKSPYVAFVEKIFSAFVIKVKRRE